MEKEQCTFNPQLSSLTQYLSKKSNERLTTEIQSPRVNVLDLLRTSSPNKAPNKPKEKVSRNKNTLVENTQQKVSICST